MEFGVAFLVLIVPCIFVRRERVQRVHPADGQPRVLSKLVVALPTNQRRFVCRNDRAQRKVLQDNYGCGALSGFCHISVLENNKMHRINR